MALEETLSHLCAATKLERDRAEVKFRELVPSITAADVAAAHTWISAQLQRPDAEAPWEARFGSLTAVRILEAAGGSGEALRARVQAAVMRCLEDAEFRVRIGAGECLGAFCRSGGLPVFREYVEAVKAGVRANLERCAEVEAAESASLSSEEGEADVLRRKLSSEQIFHDTAGWKSLETWMRCLQNMVEGVTEKEFQNYEDPEFFPLLFDALAHTNRFVRETGYNLLGVSVSASRGCVQTVRIAEQLASGLADNWSQVRMAASVATRQFLYSYGLIPPTTDTTEAGEESAPAPALRLALESSPDERQRVLDLLLPPLCLNRHYLAEGVRLHSVRSWRLLAGEAGPALVAAHLDAVVAFYLRQADADNHAVREAACACMAELAAKVPHEAVRPAVERLLGALVLCFADDSWPVRDTACLAAAQLASAFAAECRPRQGRLLSLCSANLKDGVPSVRQGAAGAVRALAEAYPGEDGAELRAEVLAMLREGLKAVERQEEHSEAQPGLDKAHPAVFGVVGSAAAGHGHSRFENQVMYSCGSLAPKMLKGSARTGGCHDGSFARPAEPWEVTDGCVHLLAELCAVPALHAALLPLIPLLADATRHRHFAHHVYLLESVCRRLPDVARGLGKRQFKAHLEPFLDGLAHGVDSDNGLAAAAAQSCVRELARLVGPGILRGRVEMHDPSLVPKLAPFMA